MHRPVNSDRKVPRKGRDGPRDFVQRDPPTRKATPIPIGPGWEGPLTPSSQALNPAFTGPPSGNATAEGRRLPRAGFADNVTLSRGLFPHFLGPTPCCGRVSVAASARRPSSDSTAIHPLHNHQKAGSDRVGLATFSPPTLGVPRSPH